MKSQSSDGGKEVAPSQCAPELLFTTSEQRQGVTGSEGKVGSQDAERNEHRGSDSDQRVASAAPKPSEDTTLEEIEVCDVCAVLPADLDLCLCKDDMRFAEAHHEERKKLIRIIEDVIRDKNAIIDAKNKEIAKFKEQKNK